MAKFVFTDDAGKEREFEVGMDEFFKGLSSSALAAWIANIKRTYDEYQDVGVKSARSQGKLADRIGMNAATHDQNVNNVSLQALQGAVTTQDMLAKNAVTTIDMVGKQAVRHGDVAIDGHWGIRESDVWLTLLATNVADTYGLNAKDVKTAMLKKKA